MVQLHLDENENPEELSDTIRSNLEFTGILSDCCRAPDLDFFLILSSSQRLLANKDAGESLFELSSHLAPSMTVNKFGHKYVQVYLSGMQDSGYIVSDPHSEKATMSEGLVPMTETELDVILQSAMSPRNPDLRPQWMFFGFDRISVTLSDNQVALDSPLFVHVGPVETSGSNAAKSPASRVDVKSFEHAKSREDAQKIAATALITQISSHVAIEQSMIDSNTAVEDFGLDSLVLWGLRNWILGTFKADISASEISDAKSVIDLALKIVDRSTFKSFDERAGRSNIRESEDSGAAQNDHPLARQPLPSLQDTLQVLLEAILPFTSAEEFKATSAAVNSFQKYGLVGEQLQNRLLLRDSDPKTENWLADLYTRHRFLRSRESVVARSSYFRTHPSGAFPHEQAERAAIVTLASLFFKQQLESGKLARRHQPITRQPLDSESYQYLFNTCREPHIEEDVIVKHPSSDNIVVLRYGHFFTVDLSSIVTIEDLIAMYRHILINTPREMSWVGVLTTDGRGHWAKVRREFSLKT